MNWFLVIKSAIATGNNAPNVIGENNIQKNEKMDKKLRLTRCIADCRFCGKFVICAFN